MNYSRLVKLNKRQFDKQCNIEGQDIYNYSKSTSEKVIFGRTNNSKSTQDKITIYYSADSSVEKGDILRYKNNYYIVQNQNCPENDAWHVSLLIKCNTVWNLFGEVVPLVSTDLSSANPSNGTVPTVGGTINLYTKDIDLIHKKIGINDTFMDFGGCYRLINKFFIDGFAFLYFQRETFVSSLDFSIKCANKSLNISSPTQTKFYLVSTDSNDTNYYLPTASFTYASSNESVAKVNEDGIILPFKDGEFDVIARCKYTFDYGDIITSKNTKTYTYTMPFGVNVNPGNSGGSGSTEEEPDDSENQGGNTGGSTGGNSGNDNTGDGEGSGNTGSGESDGNTGGDSGNQGGSDDSGNSGGGTIVLPDGEKYLQLASTSGKHNITIGYNRVLTCKLYINGKEYQYNEIPTLKYRIISDFGTEVYDASEHITLKEPLTPHRFNFILNYNDVTEVWVVNGYTLRVIATLSDGTSGYIDLYIKWL